MKFGAVLPVNEIAADTGAVKAWAVAAEELGYDRIVAYDHVLGAVHEDREPRLTGPYTENDPFREPMVFFGYLAGVTSRVELMTGVLVLPQRQTALVAKQAAEIDLLSDGRFVLGVGTGWNFVEYESLGTEFHDRARRFDEQIELLRRLWGERVVDFDGRFHRIDRAGLYPLPERQIPIWFGGWTDAAIRRAAAVGDGFYFGGAGSRILGQLEQLREQITAGGRDASAFGVACEVNASRGLEQSERVASSWKEADGTYVFVGTMTPSGATTELPRCKNVDEHIARLASMLEMLRAV